MCLSGIYATARSEAPLAEIFRALFPCASITGAPKAKTMEILSAIEAFPRRIYTGAFGWLKPGRQAHFNFAIRTVLAESFPSSPQRVRLLLHSDGRLEGTFLPIDKAPSDLLKLSFARQAVDSRNILLFHKTTRREIYEKALSEAGDADEVVLWNERGEITECCTANLVIEKNGELITPAVTCGLLQGTYRRDLLRRGIIREEVINRQELSKSARIYLVNAVRKWRRAELLPDCNARSKKRALQ
ncbi:MAG: aminotransferase class IV [Deltaproteobacteria bacterium]|nr:aminotransferase class IV [Deltaproteobacteria bacterium]